MQENCANTLRITYLCYTIVLKQTIDYLYIVLLNFSGETYDESEALGEPLAEATQNDPTILPAYGAPAEYAPAKKY